MDMELKVLGQGNRWTHVDAEELVDTTLLDYMLTHPRPLVAAIMEGGNAVFYVANKKEYVDMMLKKGPAVHCNVLQEMMGSKIVPALVAGTFPGSKLLRFETTQGELLP